MVAGLFPSVGAWVVGSKACTLSVTQVALQLSPVTQSRPWSSTYDIMKVKAGAYMSKRH